MSNGNFPNGSLVMRIWRFEGGVELVAKFQYFDHAKLFAETLLARDVERDQNMGGWFYLAVCDNECKAQAFQPKAGGPHD